MKFNTIIKKSIAVSSLALIATACKPSMIEEQPALFAIASSQIRGLAEGNCAISVNLESLYAGAIVRAAVTSGSAGFSTANYNAATGLAVADVANVSYNRKYDAFFSDGGAWTETVRNQVIAGSKANTDLASLSGGLIAYCSAQLAAGNTALATAGATTSGTLQAVANSLFNDFSDAEKAAINQVIDNNAGFGGAGINSWADLVASTTGGVGLANGSNARCFGTTTATISTNLGAIVNGIATTAGSADAVVSAYQARLAHKNGAAVLACARIPASQCNVGALTTASLDADKASVVNSFDALMANSACDTPIGQMNEGFLPAITVGIKDDDTITGFTSRGRYQRAANEGQTTGFDAGSAATLNRLLASRAYPKANALTQLNASFSIAFPIRSGNTAYSTTTWTGGSNFNVKSVGSCEGIGLAVGPAPGATEANKKILKGAAEISYAFSPQGTAASNYASTIGATNSPADTQKAIACNKSFRERFSIPLAIGGGKLPAVNVIAGDGAETSLLSACVYGGTKTSTDTIASILSSSISGLAACPTNASTGASTFANEGLNSISGSFPYKTAPE